jgi:hypothetical protein
MTAARSTHGVRCRLLPLFVILTALVLAGCAGIAAAAAIHGLGAQNRVRAFTPAAQLVARRATSQTSCSRPGFTVSEAQVAVGFCVAAEGGSALADASSAAFKAADNAGDWTVSAKHLFGAGGRWAKFAEGTNPTELAQEALRSPDAQFLPNPNGAPGSFLVRTDLGRVVGSAGQTAVRVVVSNDGRIITAFPVR